jgi:antagonist of KipI
MIAVCGADFGVRLDGAVVSPWRAASVSAGATLEMAAAASGCRACIAFRGGIAVPEVLGSRSTYLPGAFGGHEGRALRSGDRLPLGASNTGAPRDHRARLLAPSLVPVYSGTLRVIAGRDAPRLTASGRAHFWGEPFAISPQSDRMGYRLEGPQLELDAQREVLSAGVSMGTIQLPPGGTPILLMADRQTTGGYPVLGHVASVDLGSAAQLRPGDAVRFEEISLGAAQRLYLERERAVDALRLALRHAP